jgi:opacity protein-like surface antigen
MNTAKIRGVLVVMLLALGFAFSASMVFATENPLDKLAALKEKYRGDQQAQETIGRYQKKLEEVDRDLRFKATNALDKGNYDKYHQLQAERRGSLKKIYDEMLQELQKLETAKVPPSVPVAKPREEAKPPPPYRLEESEVQRVIDKWRKVVEQYYDMQRLYFMQLDDEKREKIFKILNKMEKDDFDLIERVNEHILKEGNKDIVKYIECTSMLKKINNEIDTAKEKLSNKKLIIRDRFMIFEDMLEEIDWILYDYLPAALPSVLKIPTFEKPKAETREKEGKKEIGKKAIGIKEGYPEKREEKKEAKPLGMREPGKPAVTPTAPAALAAATPPWLRGGYVALNLGVGLTSSASFSPSFAANYSDRDLRVNSAGSMSFPGNVNPSVVAGVRIGRYGCCFSDAPIWNYFGWSLDLSYQRYSLSQQSGTFQRTSWVNGDLFSQGTGTAAFQGDGSLFTLAFLVNARYGFLPTPENPFGTLQPFVGVGPALLVNRLDPKITLPRFNGVPVNGGLDFNGETSVNLGLAVEAGVRYYPLQHVFLDLSYRYLHGWPDFTFTSSTASMRFNNPLNNYAIRFGVGYAF